MSINLSDWKMLLDLISKDFSICYADFSKDEFRSYRERKVVGFIRFEDKKIFFDNKIEGKVEKITWAHEALSIYYYHVLKIIRHDDEIEEEARALCKDKRYTGILNTYISKIKNKEPFDKDTKDLSQ